MDWILEIPPFKSGNFKNPVQTKYHGIFQTKLSTLLTFLLIIFMAVCIFLDDNIVKENAYSHENDKQESEQCA